MGMRSARPQTSFSKCGDHGGRQKQKSGKVWQEGREKEGVSNYFASL